MTNIKPDEIPEVFDSSSRFTLVQFCALCRVEQQAVERLVDEGILRVNGSAPDSWTFSFRMVKRLNRACRLHRDLELNLAGVALSVELLEEIDSLKEELNRINVSHHSPDADIKNG